MASAKLFGCTINVEAEEECGVGGDGVGVGGSTTSVEVSPSGFQPVVEVTSLSFCFSPFNQREIGASNPYLPFAEWSSDSGSVSMDSGTDPHNSFIDFFDRESYEVDTVDSFHLSPNQMISSSGDFDTWRFHEMEEDIDLGLGIGSGAGSGSGSGSGSGQLTVDLDWEGFQPTVIDMGSDNGNRESDSGVVEIGTSVGGEAMMADEELEWEDLQWVEEPVHVSVFRVEEEAEEEEFSLASRDDEHDLDWQVLLAVDNAVDLFEADDIMVDPGEMDFSFYLASIDEYGGNHGDYDAIFGQMFDNNEEAGIIGSPPASKSVVDDLPAVEITSVELNNGNIVCAICKDEIAVEEKVKMLPCRHYYHGECIIPWLGIRNTCPVCRYELPTDDLEYERNRRSQRRGSSGLEMDFMSE